MPQLMTLARQVGESPMSLFGFKPQLLLHQQLGTFVDVFQALASETEDLVARMVAKVGLLLRASGRLESRSPTWRMLVHTC